MFRRATSTGVYTRWRWHLRGIFRHRRSLRLCVSVYSDMCSEACPQKNTCAHSLWYTHTCIHIPKNGHVHKKSAHKHSRTPTRNTNQSTHKQTRLQIFLYIVRDAAPEGSCVIPYYLSFVITSPTQPSHQPHLATTPRAGPLIVRLVHVNLQPQSILAGRICGERLSP